MPADPNQPDSDGALLVRHRNGDAAAFAELVGRTQRLVYGYLLRCGVERAACDDLFQEIFVGVHAAAAAYDAGRPLKPWLLSIVANTVRSHHRRSRRHDTALASGRLVEDRAALPDGQQLAEARETVAWLERALAALPLAQREVVVLCCVEQLPQDEVAAALAMPVNTVKTHLRRARLTLAQGLARRTAALRREVS